jgi:hypothetical protein
MPALKGVSSGGIHHNAVGISIRRFTQRLRSDPCPRDFAEPFSRSPGADRESLLRSWTHQCPQRHQRSDWNILVSHQLFLCER